METLSGVELDVGGDPDASSGFRGRRLQRSSRSCRGSPARRVPGRAGRASPIHRRRRRAREDDDGRDDRVRPPRARARSRVDHRRRRAAARRQRAALGRAGSSSKGDESDRSIALLRPEIAVLTNIELDHHAAFASTTELESFFEEWARGSAERRPRLGARARGVRARGAGRAQPDERRRRAGRARARRRRALRRRARPRSLRGRCATVRAGCRPWRRSRLRRLCAQPDGARGDAANGTGANRGTAHRGLPAARLRAHAPALP